MRQQKNYKANFGSVITIVDKQHTDRLRLGMRIVPKKRSDFQSNPTRILCFIQIKGCQMYVAYLKQAITCKYCDDAGFVRP